MQSIGIKSVDGGFRVSGSSPSGITFYNLWHGIDAVSVNTNRPFRVSGSTFRDNQTGIIARNIHHVVALSNKFYVGGNQNPNEPVNIGISLKNSSGFSIEENHFDNSGAATKYGILINNSGVADNQIYNNWFNGMDYGNIALAVNRDNDNPALHGLQYLCNKNQNLATTSHDFYISSSSLNGGKNGIRVNQGANNLTAGNTFLTRW